MGIVNKEIFVERFVNDPHVRNHAALARGQYTYAGSADRESALEIYEAIKQHVRSRGRLHGKVLRPWELDRDLYSNLNRDEPWLGVELETGFQSAEARAEVLGEVWDRWDNVVFDGEGDGEFPSEITFAPVELSKIDSGEAPVMQYMEMINSEHKDKMYKSREQFVGTHFNISIPGLTRDNINETAQYLNDLITGLPHTYDKRKITNFVLFGRRDLYGMFYARSNNNASSVWLEGKMFRTTYDMEQFKQYIRVMKGFIKIVQKYIEDPVRTTRRSAGAIKYGVTNPLDVLVSDAEPVTAHTLRCISVATRQHVQIHIPEELANSVTDAARRGFFIQTTSYGNVYGWASDLTADSGRRARFWTEEFAELFDADQLRAQAGELISSGVTLQRSLLGHTSSAIALFTTEAEKLLKIAKKKEQLKTNDVVQEAA